MYAGHNHHRDARNISISMAANEKTQMVLSHDVSMSVSNGM